jgi:peptidoglycan/LPS O-acetylase OafA/YrhL
VGDGAALSGTPLVHAPEFLASVLAATLMTAPVTAATSDHPQITALDGVRGLAIGVVLIAHMTVIGPELSWIDALLTRVAWTGWIGVDVFFVLSGFLITGILLDSKGDPHYFRSFYARRVLRIFPLYYFIVVVSLLVLPHLHHPKAQNFGRIAGDELYYWFFLSNFSISMREALRHGILDVSWSLAIEEQFYLVWPLVVLLTSARSLKQLAVVLAVFSLCLRSWIMLHDTHQWWYAFFWTPCRLDSLAAGAWAACVVREEGGLARLQRLSRPAIAVGALAFFLIWLREGGDLDAGFFKNTIGFSLLALLSLGLLSAALSDARTTWLARVFESKPLRTLGKYSYALYLLNMPLRAVIRDLVYPTSKFVTFHGARTPGQLLFYLLAFPVVFSGAWLSWHLYEKHFLALKRFFPSRPDLRNQLQAQRSAVSPH